MPVHLPAGEAALDSFAVLRNEGPDTVTLELLSSFSLTGLTPFAGDEAPGDLILHRLRSAWSGEGRLVSDHVEDLSLEPAWASWERCLHFGQVGSWPVRGRHWIRHRLTRQSHSDADVQVSRENSRN